MLKDEEILDLCLEYEGNPVKMNEAILYHYSVKHHDYSGGPYITINSPLYPIELLDLDIVPLILFYKGDISLLKTRKLSIIGSRFASTYGISITSQICEKLKDNFTLISGIAKGIDTIVHTSCVNNNDTIAVLGCGIDYIYPYENKDLFKQMENNQLLISEYPLLTKPTPEKFPQRNRIIAALGEKLIVTEANMRSGTFTTCNEAIKLSREIYVVPYPLITKDSGCNYLIQEGANIIYSFSVLDEIINSIDKIV